MSEPASISMGIATRYATAVFELAKESGALDTLDSNVDALDAVLKDSADFNDLIKSPVYSRGAQESAISAIAVKMGLSEILANTLRLMASKRRLFVLPQLVGALRDLISEEKGEVVAEVTAAREMSPAQQSKLVDTLKAKLGQTVKLNIRVDETLIGGLIVKVGSKMIDTSIASKLSALQNTMKEVG